MGGSGDKEDRKSWEHVSEYLSELIRYLDGQCWRGFFVIHSVPPSSFESANDKGSYGICAVDPPHVRGPLYTAGRGNAKGTGVVGRGTGVWGGSCTDPSVAQTARSFRMTNQNPIHCPSSVGGQHARTQMRGLKDKRVLITGGASGIGAATAARFLEEGSRVCVLDRDATACGHIKHELPLLGEAIIADVTDLMQVEAAFAEAIRLMDGVTCSSTMRASAYGTSFSTSLRKSGIA